MTAAIGCVLMASGLSERYGKNKLLELLDGREILLHTASRLLAAGLIPVAVTRSGEVKALMDREGFACVLHDGPRKSDTIHAGIRNTDPDAAGYLFMPGDQPMVLPASLQKLQERFLSCPERAVRLAFRDTEGSPVLFPAACREELMAYEGDRGGSELIRRKLVPCDPVEVSYPWELWDADTPENMERIRNAYSCFVRAAGR